MQPPRGWSPLRDRCRLKYSMVKRGRQHFRGSMVMWRLASVRSIVSQGCCPSISHSSVRALGVVRQGWETRETMPLFPVRMSDRPSQQRESLRESELDKSVEVGRRTKYLPLSDPAENPAPCCGWRSPVVRLRFCLGGGLNPSPFAPPDLPSSQSL